MRVCAGEGCEKEGTMRCPTCIKLHIEEGSYFCDQVCFKANWAKHKALHKKAKLEAAKIQQENSATDPKDLSVQLDWPGYRFSGPLRPHKQSPRRLVPKHIQRPDYANNDEGYPFSEAMNKSKLRCLSKEEIAKMKHVCKLGREVLDACGAAIRPGITTDEIDRVCHEASIERDCYPSPLNYFQFPKSCCTSVNEVICHGIPDGYVLQDGDIVNVDISVFHKGYHADLNETFLVGEVDEKTLHLVKTTYECLDMAIKSCKPGMRYRDLGNIISKVCGADTFACWRAWFVGVIGLFVRLLAQNKAVGIMKPGHVFTIEPMINLGTWQDQTWPDKWTSTTIDGKRSAQFEHTLLITETGVEVLTARTKDSPVGPQWFQTVLEKKAAEKKSGSD
ncbi:methionine aminopeptidase 1 [Salpingoeca rosetta]|uniref:Methionine aminopeptidase n=1 Tax=Salpingoeca rosetta (strain ATCC 50818 / BSB-021) TaxID=946362 RepID=F2U8M1_SALR5|nr:methionine aminopeptidase 1 [Salpingoeca rosetta]EGD72729.1 methionine aminopeptidase 1 [Salpingoeca rosetta]|eukprot:XP_004994552.1 methionine aminopeptidase 1 [Salpingoeca rosetta]